jgi:hypothetical protein
MKKARCIFPYACGWTLAAVVIVIALVLVTQADYPSYEELRALADMFRPVIIPLTGGQ